MTGPQPPAPAEGSEPARGRVEFTGGGEPAGASVGGETPADAPLVEPAADAPLVEPYWVELSDLVGSAERNRAEMARLHAERAEICADALRLVAHRVEQRRIARGGREIGDAIPLREVIAELAAALRVGERTIQIWLGDGAALVSTFPATLEALREGRIDEKHASAIIDAATGLTDENRARYEDAVLPVAETATAPELREAARVIAARLQPDIVAQRAADAVAARQVKMYALHDGLARLLLDAPAALVQGIFERVTDMAIALDDHPVTFTTDESVVTETADPGSTDADTVTDADTAAAATDADADADSDADADADADSDADADADADDRSLDQRRADILCDLLLTGASAAHGDTGLGAIRATVQITIPILTLIGESDDPATLDGHGPIDPQTARELAGSSPCWQRVMIHPITAEPLRIDTYRPSKRLRRLLNARDRHCRWPGCRRPARRCEADHTIPFNEDGPICRENLECLCVKHHTLKHASLWHVEQLGGGALEFTSPTGRTYRNNAPPVVENTNDPPWAKYLRVAYDPADAPGF